MKRKIVFLITIVVGCALVLATAPLFAEADNPAEADAAPLLIVELQTGSGTSASEEFIELYNASPAVIDLTKGHWQLQIANSTATDWTTLHRSISLSGFVAPGGYYMVASSVSTEGQSTKYLANSAGAWYPAGLAAAGGHIRLVQMLARTGDDNNCTETQTVADELEWGKTIDNRTQYAAAIAPGKSLQRAWAGASYIDTDNDTDDFTASDPTPFAQNTPHATAGEPHTVAAMAEDNCIITPASEAPASPVEPQPSASQPSVPAADKGLLSPQISELLPNPAAPELDANDEFIELYNPNTKAFDLSGFKLQTGIATKHSYAFPVGTSLAPEQFMAFYSKDTELVLSNTSGQASLLDPLGTVMAVTDPYGIAVAGSSWTNASGAWQWSIVPTPNAVNQVATPEPPAPKAATPVTSKKVAAAKETTKTVKAASTTKPKKTPAKESTTTAAAAEVAPKKNSIHSGVLAAVALLALLYGAYEYRHDVANKINQFRTNRTASRAIRQEVARRRGN